MDSLIAIKGKDFVIIAADTVNVYSVLRMKVTFMSFLELWWQNMELGWIKIDGHWRRTFWCPCLRWLYSKKSCLIVVQKWYQTFYWWYRQFYQKLIGWSSQKRSIQRQLLIGRIWRRCSKALLARLFGLSFRAQ